MPSSHCFLPLCFILVGHTSAAPAVTIVQGASFVPPMSNFRGRTSADPAVNTFLARPMRPAAKKLSGRPFGKGTVPLMQNSEGERPMAPFMQNKVPFMSGANENDIFGYPAWLLNTGKATEEEETLKPELYAIRSQVEPGQARNRAVESDVPARHIVKQETQSLWDLVAGAAAAVHFWSFVAGSAASAMLYYIVAKFRFGNGNVASMEANLWGRTELQLAGAGGVARGGRSGVPMMMALAKQDDDEEQKKQKKDAEAKSTSAQKDVSNGQKLTSKDVQDESKLFDQMDTNNDGVLSRAEIDDAFQKGLIASNSKKQQADESSAAADEIVRTPGAPADESTEENQLRNVDKQAEDYKKQVKKQVQYVEAQAASRKTRDPPMVILSEGPDKRTKKVQLQSATANMADKKVTIVGSGNWGMAVALIVAENMKKHAEFDDTLTVYMFDEEVEHEGEKRKLSEVFNETKENVKYLPGKVLPSNVKAEPDLKKAVQDADILIWVMPHQFVPRTVQNMGKVKEGCVSVSGIKGGLELEGGKLGLCSDSLRELLGHEVGVLMGANVANEVADGQLCECTLGLETGKHEDVLRKVFDTPSFRVNTVDDIAGVELCGALKNVVALGAGFCDGLGYGGNTKAALIRIGLEEMKTFIRHFYPDVDDSIFLESCGVADLITTCFGGRNRKCAEAFVHGEGVKSWETIEKELLNGQKLQGTLTAEEIWPVMVEHGLCDKLPLLTTIYKIAFQNQAPETIVKLPQTLPVSAFLADDGVLEADKKAATGKNVTIVGSGNWGMALAKIVAENTKKHPELNDTLTVYMFEEEVEHEGEKRKLSEVFNETKENVKYLPGKVLPSNVKAEPDLEKAVQDADILVWVMPHQFVPRTVQNMGKIKEGCVSVSGIKGGLELDGGKLGLCSDSLRELLGHEVGVLMGANVANEVAEGQLCECTLGLETGKHEDVLRKVFDTPSFRVNTVDDIAGVELCGALKNVVALGAGFCDGLGYGGNTKAALIRIGLEEMKTFIRHFYPDVDDSIFLESCGVADLITTCFGGRNRKCAEAFVHGKGVKSWDTIEKDLLGGQKLQGTLTAEEIWPVMVEHGLCEKLPLLTTIYKIAFQNQAPETIVRLPQTLPVSAFHSDGGLPEETEKKAA